MRGYISEPSFSFVVILLFILIYIYIYIYIYMDLITIFQIFWIICM
jgi:hypothetical protein